MRLNPVWALELRTRVLRFRTAVIIFVYLGLLTAVLRVLALGVEYSGIRAQCIGPTCYPVRASPWAVAAGRSMLHWLLFAMLGLVCFIVPALTAGAVVSERARQTLVPLLVTLQRPRQIVVGKLAASLAFTGLLLVASLPVLAATFWAGGVSAWDALKGVAFIALVAVTLGSMGLACSVYLRRFAGAVVASFALMLALTVGTPMLYGMQFVLKQVNPRALRSPPSPAVLVANPFVAMADLIGSPQRMADPGLDSPFDQIKGVLRLLPAGPVGSLGVGPGGRYLPAWPLASGLYVLISAGSVALAARGLRTPARRPL